MEKINAQVHRFGDSVAICLGGKTVYLSQADSLDLSYAIQKAEYDIANAKFTDSTVGTFSAKFEDNRYRDK